MHELVVCEGPGRFDTIVDLQSISDVKQHPSTVLWLDLTSPTPDELQLLRDEFQFHDLALEDVVRQQQRPKVDSYGSYYFVVFYCIHAHSQSGRLESTPLYMFIGSNYLVTIHAEPIDQIRSTVTRWRAPDSPLEQDVGALIYALLDAIVDDYFPVMDRVSDRAEDLEEHIFGTFNDQALESIFQLKKDLLFMRRLVAPERDVLNVLLRRDIPVFDSNDITYLQDVYDHLVRVTDAIDTYRDLLSSALDTYLSVQSNQLNQVVKVLTITSIVLMSVTLVAGIYGMNFRNMPELEWRFGYAWALGLMVAIAGASIAIFRRLKWL